MFENFLLLNSWEEEKTEEGVLFNSLSRIDQTNWNWKLTAAQILRLIDVYKYILLKFYYSNIIVGQSKFQIITII